jgi:peptide deformylase
MSKRAFEDPDQEQRRIEALAEVRQYGEPVLRTPCDPVVVFDDALRDEVDRMIQLMHDARGVGLAAPQLGRLSRLIVLAPDPEAEAYALINPRIVARSDEEEVDTEGCLSIGEISVPVSRSVSIRVEAQTAGGAPVAVDAEGFEARVIQHEMDHLDGILILDRTTPEERREALREMRDVLSPR